MLRRLVFWLLWPGLFVYFRCSRRTRVLLSDGDRVLLVKDRFSLWFGQERWALPGGGLRWFETPETGAAREVREELGLHVQESQLAMLGHGWSGGHGLRYRAYFMQAHISRTAPMHLRASEIVAAKWHTIQSLDTQSLQPEVHTALQLLVK